MSALGWLRRAAVVPAPRLAFSMPPMLRPFSAAIHAAAASATPSLSQSPASALPAVDTPAVDDGFPEPIVPIAESVNSFGSGGKGLLDFFDSEKGWYWADTDPKTGNNRFLYPRHELILFPGRGWTCAELRVKSFDDLHKLWWICIKEQNKLLSQKDEARMFKVIFPHPQRLQQVRLTMRNIRAVLHERLISYKQAQAIVEREAKRAELFAAHLEAFKAAQNIPADQRVDVPQSMLKDVQKEMDRLFPVPVHEIGRKVEERRRVEQALVVTGTRGRKSRSTKKSPADAKKGTRWKKKRSASTQDDDGASFLESDASGWGAAESVDHFSGPIMLVSTLPVGPAPACLVVNDKTSAISIQSLYSGSPVSVSEVEPIHVGQVFLASRLPTGESRVSIKSAFDKYLSCDKFGVVTCDTDAVGPYEEWEVIRRPDGFALQSVIKGAFLSCEVDEINDEDVDAEKRAKDALGKAGFGVGGGRICGTVRADAESIGVREVFQIRCQNETKLKAMKKKKKTEEVNTTVVDAEQLKKFQSYGRAAMTPEEAKILKRAQKQVISMFLRSCPSVV
ncbi:hypothetical protein HDU84_004931 [Entophlyctis sp. JEL0112]|nr:hypothetical protein HDU84_004931 [Entophlyctis sp. JEL0112]